MTITVIHSDCLEYLKTLPDNSFSSIVTDPPYGIKFLNKKWDYNIPNVEVWKECLRVLKPGGHLLCFSANKGHHRMAVNIEDAGFEIRDNLYWIHGQGMPHGLNISKGIDKKLGKERGKVKHKPRPDTSGTMSSKQDSRPWIEKSREVGYHETDDDVPVSALAKDYYGYYTALKPAVEPIILARKPLSEKTIVDNVLKWGTGGLNIEDCSIATEDNLARDRSGNRGMFDGYAKWDKDHPESRKTRYPANVMFEDNPEAIEHLPEGKARYFYCAKVHKRDEFNTHPTVKPLPLIEYLVTLINPPNGNVLDIYAGSGTLGVVCKKLNIDCTVVEREKEYIDVINLRLNG